MSRKISIATAKWQCKTLESEPGITCCNAAKRRGPRPPSLLAQTLCRRVGFAAGEARGIREWELAQSGTCHQRGQGGSAGDRPNALALVWS